MFIAILLFVTLLGLVAWWHTIKPLPKGLSLKGSSRVMAADRIRFLYDLTTLGRGGQPLQQQQIFPALFTLIENAEHYILFDFFLLNDHQGRQQISSRPLAGELAARLIAKKQQCPDLAIDVISDPINSVYDEAPAAILEELQHADINVITTRTDMLRDSNPLYSTLWRILLRRLPGDAKILPHPFDRSSAKVAFPGWLKLLNFKANHRKVALADHAGGFTVLVTSANPHGGSSLHSNAALLATDDSLAADLYASELAVAQLSGQTLAPLPKPSRPATPLGKHTEELAVSLITEGVIGTQICERLNRSGAHDSIRLAMFYLADRGVIRALLAAADHGADIQVILDPNRDAFGYGKNGVPNQPVAAELQEKSEGRITIRWYQTHGEQFHTKFIYIENANGTAELLLGSANLTRRNLRDYNLETNLHVSGDRTAPLFSDTRSFWQKIWYNADAEYTVPYAVHADTSIFKKLQYHIQERCGLSTF